MEGMKERMIMKLVKGAVDRRLMEHFEKLKNLEDQGEVIVTFMGMKRYKMVFERK